MLHKELIYLKGFAKGMNLENTIKAINVAVELHDGQKRLTGEDYIIHPTRVASVLVSLGIHDDIIIATALLHDVIEDCHITKDELIEKYHIDSRVANNVQILSKRKDMSTNIYYDKIATNPVCLLVKIADRCHNISTMADGFTPEKISSYINETKEYIYPLYSSGKKLYPQYGDQLFILKCQIESVILMAKSFIHVSEKNKELTQKLNNIQELLNEIKDNSKLLEKPQDHKEIIDRVQEYLH